MDGSPYTPGAGHRPPVLAGRDEFLRAWRTGLNDVAATGRQRAPDMILTAPRGVGKTATVLAFQDLCQDQGYEVVRLQAAAANASLVDSLLRRARSRVEQGAGPWARSRRACERIAGVNVSVGGIGAAIATHKPPNEQPDRFSPEDVAEALATLAREVRKDKPRAGVLIAIDEIQAAAPADLTLIAAALHTLNTEYPDAPVMFAASGLPNTFEVLKQAGVTHPDRLFRFRPVALLLKPADARFAIVEAARQHDVAWEPAATDAIVTVSSGYPAHLQVFADETWMAAKGPQVITQGDARAGITAAAEVLERESFGPRFDAMTPRERELLAAIAVHGGRVGTADLAVTLGRPQKSLSDLRDTLLREGDVYVPHRGELALTVPVFGPFVLASYEQARQSATASLLALEEMQRNVQALRHNRLPQPGAAPPRRAVWHGPAVQGGGAIQQPPATPELPPPAPGIDL